MRSPINRRLFSGIKASFSLDEGQVSTLEFEFVHPRKDDESPEAKELRVKSEE